jgi:hypothetical protein
MAVDTETATATQAEQVHQTEQASQAEVAPQTDAAPQTEQAPEIQIPKKYKAAIYDKPGSISTKVVELDMPEPGPGEVLINL